MSDYPKNVVIYGLPRSGTSILYETVRAALNIKNSDSNCLGEIFEDKRRREFESIDEIIDHINFISNSDKPVIINMHSDDLLEFTMNQLNKWKSVLENRNFHVIKIMREDLNELILSYYVARTTQEWSGYTVKKYTGEYEILKQTIQLIPQHYKMLQDNFLEIPISQEVTFEQFLKDRQIEIGDLVCSLDDVKIRSQLHLKAPSKAEKLLNYDEVLEWYNELFEEYGKLYL